jgi:hypothetical protein
MMKLSHYRFRSVWTVDALPDEAVAVLRDLSRYPQWWRKSKIPTGSTTTASSCA